MAYYRNFWGTLGYCNDYFYHTNDVFKIRGIRIWKGEEQMQKITIKKIYKRSLYLKLFFYILIILGATLASINQFFENSLIVFLAGFLLALLSGVGMAIIPDLYEKKAKEKMKRMERRGYTGEGLYNSGKDDW